MFRPTMSACIAILGCAAAFGQLSETLTFEVASVKPSDPVPPNGRVFFGPPRGGPGTQDPTRITWTYATLNNFLMMAYDVPSYQLSGPDWLGTQRYDVTANVPAGANKEQVRAMWRSLLAERFRVVLHHESKEFQVEELVIGKSGHKLKESAEDPIAAQQAGPPSFQNGELASPGLVTSIAMGPHGPTAHAAAKAQPLSKLTAMLANQLHRPVLDKTGLAGIYDFTLDFTPDLNGTPIPGRPAASGVGPASTNPGDDIAEPSPDLAGAVQRQLGLRLVGSRAKLDVIVIDKAEKVPTGN
jgi:uncharacterized protein (TIGR03435 family)